MFKHAISQSKVTIQQKKSQGEKKNFFSTFTIHQGKMIVYICRKQGEGERIKFDYRKVMSKGLFYREVNLHHHSLQKRIAKCKKNIQFISSKLIPNIGTFTSAPIKILNVRCSRRVNFCIPSWTVVCKR